MFKINHLCQVKLINNKLLSDSIKLELMLLSRRVICHHYRSRCYNHFIGLHVMHSCEIITSMTTIPFPNHSMSETHDTEPWLSAITNVLLSDCDCLVDSWLEKRNVVPHFLMNHFASNCQVVFLSILAFGAEMVKQTYQTESKAGIETPSRPSYSFAWSRLNILMRHKRHNFPVHIVGIHKLNVYLCTPLRLHTTSFSKYCKPWGVQERGKCLHLHMWCDGISCKWECYNDQCWFWCKFPRPVIVAPHTSINFQTQRDKVDFTHSVVLDLAWFRIRDCFIFCKVKHNTRHTDKHTNTQAWKQQWK